MATTIKLEGEARSEFGKGVARRLRVANKIPGHHLRRRRRARLRDLADARDHPGPCVTPTPCSPSAFDGNTKNGRRQGRAEEPGQAHHRAR